jgi:hypothetical protein
LNRFRPLWRISIVVLLFLLACTVSLVLVRSVDPTTPHQQLDSTCRHLTATDVFMAESAIANDVAALKAENALLKARIDTLTAIRSTAIKPLPTSAPAATANSANASRESSTAGGGDPASPFQGQLDKVRKETEEKERKKEKKWSFFFRLTFFLVCV